MVSEAEGRVRVESMKTVSSFVIEGAERTDEGHYSITVTNPVGEDKANLFVKIVGQCLFSLLPFLFTLSLLPFFHFCLSEGNSSLEFKFGSWAENADSA